MAEHVAPELREAILDPMRSAWYPEACLQEFMRAFDQEVTHGDRKAPLAAFEECTLQRRASAQLPGAALADVAGFFC